MPRFYGEERFQNPALARTAKYDTVVVGTSMSENISMDELKSQYGISAIRQTFAGSSVYEQREGLDVAIRTGQVKSVIWELNFTSFGGYVDKPKDSKAIFPTYLYDTNPFNNIEYLLDPVEMGRAWGIVTNPLPYNGSVVDYEHEKLNQWATWFSYGEDVVMADFEQQEAKGAFDATSSVANTYAWDKIYNNLKVNVFDVVEANPDIEFTFYLAPFSYLEHVSYDMMGIFQNELKFRGTLQYQLSKYNNVKLFDFQADGDIINNLDYYKDKMHYNTTITDRVVNTLLTGQATTRGEFEANQEYLRQLVVSE